MVEHYYSYTSYYRQICHRLFSQKYTYSIETSVQNTINIKHWEGNRKSDMEMHRISWKRNSNNIESSGFINACRHQSKLLLKNLKKNDSMDWKNIKETCREVFLLFLI